MEAKLIKAQGVIESASDTKLAEYHAQAQAAFYKEIRLGSVTGAPKSFAEAVYGMTKAEIAKRAVYVAAGEAAQDGQPYWPRSV